MIIKKLLAATSFALMAMGASATPLDAISGNVNIKLVGLTTEINTYAPSNETTWGVGAITQMISDVGTWNAHDSDGTYLYYMLYGIADQNIINPSPGAFDIYNIGATGGVADGLIHLDVYRTTTQIPSVDQFFNAAPGGRTGYNSYAAFAALGPAYLNLTFQPGKHIVNEVGGTNPLADETLATLVQNTNGANLPADGKGSFFANVAGGTAASKWDTNGFVNGYDFDGKYTLSTNGKSQGSGTCTDAQVRDGTCFTGLVNDPIRAIAVPEPGSLALFGLTLAGLAGARRRMSKKAK